MKEAAIICVDDERVVLNGLQSQLTRDFGSEYIIEMAESAEEALELIEDLREEGRDVPVIITDQMMPGMKGHELLIEVHQSSPQTFKILLTGQSDISAITEAVNSANLYRYIAKPWDGTDLILTVKEAIRSFYQDKQLEIQNKLLERHNRELEQLVEERTQELRIEKEKSEELLLNILPNETAQELIERGEATPRHYNQVTILFTDFQAFTKSASDITPQELVSTLNECFTAFDEIIGRHDLEKIKTIGDAYMCAGGIPTENTTNAVDAVAAAIEIRDWITHWNAARQLAGKDTWEARLGLHTGELIAGVIGKKKFAYDVWGDAVNLAARMETNSEAGKINISEATYQLVKDRFNCASRGKIEVKGKGLMEMYFVD
ncbi:MAG: response regulator [Flavobacteriales bacterium]|nr:response regulator [Flavobacteriales bacterium]MCB9205552.1 response regulator [Flavobacteriales bacterium]